VLKVEDDNMSDDAGSRRKDGAPLDGKTVVLGVTGSIAAYKAALIARLLVKAGASVHVILTERAKEFVGNATFAGITGHPCVGDMFAQSAAGETHVTLTAKADLIMIAPATADFLSRMAQGRADDVLSATVLCARSKVLVAPAMHPAMWSHPATMRNVELLKSDGRVQFVGPERGEVASGESGEGRMSEPETIVANARRLLTRADLAGKHVVITAGPTVEDIDPVRFITNRSSGKMGFAIAANAADRGARVTLVAGPVTLPTPVGVTRVDVRGARDMQAAIDRALGANLDAADALVMAAAVADYATANVSDVKLKRDAESLTLHLTKNPDLLARIGQRRSGPSPTLIGFAVETADDEALVQIARQKLGKKRVDLIVANRANEALGADTNRIWLVTETEHVLVPTAPKAEVARAILDWLAQALTERS
jgi:phosphopantothenoylcysteine decarboxylase/phosphopantothenate--cysteine ligase